jgi:hypothetical protein
MFRHILGHPSEPRAEQADHAPLSYSPGIFRICDHPSSHDRSSSSLCARLARGQALILPEQGSMRVGDGVRRTP